MDQHKLENYHVAFGAGGEVVGSKMKEGDNMGYRTESRTPWRRRDLGTQREDKSSCLLASDYNYNRRGPEQYLP